jgi:hypothetical protein
MSSLLKSVALAAVLTAPLWAAGTASAQTRPPGYYVCSYYYPFTCPDGVRGYGYYPYPGPGYVYGEVGPDYRLYYPGYYGYADYPRWHPFHRGWHHRWHHRHGDDR